MIKLGCKGTYCAGEEGSTLGVGPKSPHLLRRTASFRPLRATGNDQVKASQENQAREGYPYLSLAWRRQQFIERCHLTTACDTFGGGRGRPDTIWWSAGETRKLHKC